MSESTEYAQNAIDQTYEQTQPYIVQLVQRLALTFLPPMLLAAIIGTGGRLLLAQSIPGMATTILLLIINIAAFYASWRFLDGRYNGTALFFLYASFSRERRELKNLLVESPDSGYTLRERADKLLQSAQDLIQAVANA